MRRRQTSIPSQWLIADARTGSERQLVDLVRRLPGGTGILLLHHELAPADRQRLSRIVRRLARDRGLVLVDEAEGAAARVHSLPELRKAQLGGAELLLLSPLFPTQSHPDWRPLPRMRAAALAKLARRPVLALGGMDAQRFRRLKPLGFHGWAGIDAWLRT